MSRAAAGFSRSWFFPRPGIRAEIEPLRETIQRAPSPAVPASQRATGASLLRRLAEVGSFSRGIAWRRLVVDHGSTRDDS
jgi:hypothetical protein